MNDCLLSAQARSPNSIFPITVVPLTDSSDGKNKNPLSQEQDGQIKLGDGFVEGCDFEDF